MQKVIAFDEMEYIKKKIELHPTIMVYGCDGEELRLQWRLK